MYIEGRGWTGGLIWDYATVTQAPTQAVKQPEQGRAWTTENN